MRLFHFSDDPEIRVFFPRPPRFAADRGPERNWLNGALVWATDEAHALLYLFPRECPRIVIWSTPQTAPEDRKAWFGDRTCRAIAFVEDDWVGRFHEAALHRYLMPSEIFEEINDVGMWVSRSAVFPLGIETLRDLPGALNAAGVELLSLPRLTPLKSVWQTTLHASGIRMRNAQDWNKPG